MPNKIVIHSPIWKTRSIGIADYKITENMVIEIDYVNKDGQRLYPGKYYLSKCSALKYPTQIVKGVKLRMIPIEDLMKISERIKSEEKNNSSA